MDSRIRKIDGVYYRYIKPYKDKEAIWEFFDKKDRSGHLMQFNANYHSFNKGLESFKQFQKQ